MNVLPKSTLHNYVVARTKSHFKHTIRYMADAKQLFRVFVEKHIIHIFQIACTVAKHCGRSTLQEKDVALALDIISGGHKSGGHKKTIKPIELKQTQIRGLARKAGCQRISKNIDIVPIAECVSLYIDNIVKTLYNNPNTKTINVAKLTDAQNALGSINTDSKLKVRFTDNETRTKKKKKKKKVVKPVESDSDIETDDESDSDTEIVNFLNHILEKK